MQANQRRRDYGGEAGVSNTGGARYRAICLAGLREPVKRDAVDLAPRLIEGVGGVFLTVPAAHVIRSGIHHIGQIPVTVKDLCPVDGNRFAPYYMDVNK